MPASADSAALLRQRYRDNAPADEGPWNDTLATLLGHRSVRAFLPTPIQDPSLARLVAAAQSASTSSNLQAWSVVAVRDPVRKARLAKLGANQKMIEEAPLFLAWLADISRIRRVAAAKERPVAGADYLEAFVVGVIDATLAAQNAAVAAEALGLGVVYIGGMRNHPVEVANELGLPSGVFNVFGMCIGYPDPSRPADIKPRLPQQAVLHLEQYDAAGESQSIAAYDVVQRSFRAEQKMSPITWSDQVTDRWVDVKALQGRDRMVEALHTLGFKLR